MTIGRASLEPRWLLSALVLLLVLGHVCELPAYAGTLSQPGAEAHHGDHHAGHHANPSQISCEVIDAVANTGPSQAAYVDLTGPASVATLAPNERPSAPAKHSDVLRSRPPLFVLHAALLI